MKIKKTNKGFGLFEFKDRYDTKCSLQDSSLATKAAIWFGVDDTEPKVMAKDAKKFNIS